MRFYLVGLQFKLMELSLGLNCNVPERCVRSRGRVLGSGRFICRDSGSPPRWPPSSEQQFGRSVLPPLSRQGAPGWPSVPRAAQVGPLSPWALLSPAACRTNTGCPPTSLASGLAACRKFYPSSVLRLTIKNPLKTVPPSTWTWVWGQDASSDREDSPCSQWSGKQGAASSVTVEVSVVSLDGAENARPAGAALTHPGGEGWEAIALKTAPPPLEP